MKTNFNIYPSTGWKLGSFTGEEVQHDPDHAWSNIVLFQDEMGLDKLGVVHRFSTLDDLDAVCIVTCC